MATTRGPIPKRTDQRRRVNKPEVDYTHAAALVDVVEVPAVDDEWHPIAKRWFASLAESGQSRFFEPSDWAYATLTAEAMTRLLYADKFSATHFAAVQSAMTDLLTTEGARRRARLEIERAASDGDAEDATVTAIGSYRDQLGLG